VFPNLKRRIMERAEPIKRIFRGIIDGDATYHSIYPPGYCPRCGTRLKKIGNGWLCLNDGLLIQPAKEEPKNV
jgi:hypothetical protein